MAKPLTWTSPAFRWNGPGVLWNGVQPPPKRMNNLKASIDFTGYVAAELGPVAQMIHDSMTAAAVTFPAPPVAMTALATTIADYTAKLSA